MGGIVSTRLKYFAFFKQDGSTAETQTEINCVYLYTPFEGDGFSQPQDPFK